MPEGIETWNNTNYGNEVFNLTYTPSKATQENLQESDSDPEIESWNVESVTNTKIVMQVDFSNPSKVSSTRSDKDKINLEIIKPELFNDAENENESEDTILAQYEEDQYPWIAEIVKEILGDSYIVVLITNLALSVLFSTSMQKMWGLVNTLQILVLSVLFDVKTPINV